MSKVDKAYLKQLVETPSVTGTETRIASVVRERLSEVADEIETNVMGSVHARLVGSGSAPSVMIAAHMDEVGLMVTHISDQGFLSVAAVGGVDAAILPGMRVDVHTSTETLRFEKMGKGMAVSRGFDDKAGVYVITRVMEELKKSGKAKGDYICAATVQEEIGLRGGTTSAYGVNPDVAIAVDVTHATDYPGIDQSRYGKVICGEGPVIARGPNINPVVFERLCAAAKKEGIAVQFEAEPGVTGTDAGTMQVQRGGCACGLVSIPLRYMHTPTEVLKLSDLEETVALLKRFILDLNEDVSFVPGM